MPVQALHCGRELYIGVLAQLTRLTTPHELMEMLDYFKVRHCAKYHAHATHEERCSMSASTRSQATVCFECSKIVAYCRHSCRPLGWQRHQAMTQGRLIPSPSLASA